MAPELILENKYNIKADLWACGVILYEMMYGKNPFEKPTSMPQLAKKMKDGTISFPTRYSVDCINLVKSLLTIDPIRRIEWTDFFNHPWLSNEEEYKQDNIDSTQYESAVSGYDGDDDYINDYVVLDDVDMKKIKLYQSDVHFGTSSIYQFVVNTIGYLIS